MVKVNGSAKFEGSCPILWVLFSFGKVGREVEKVGGVGWVTKIYPVILDLFAFVKKGISINEHYSAGGKVKGKVSRVKFCFGSEAQNQAAIAILCVFHDEHLSKVIACEEYGPINTIDNVFNCSSERD